MITKRFTLILTAFILAFCGCDPIPQENGQDNIIDQPEGGTEGGETDGGGDTEGGDTGGDTGGGLPVAGYPAGAFTVESLNNEGITYMWDESVIPEITIHMTVEEWNKLLARYDEFQHNVDYFHADFTYKKGNEEIFIEDGGVRLRGNTSDAVLRAVPVRYIIRLLPTGITAISELISVSSTRIMTTLSKV